MITKLLLREKRTDINEKINDLTGEIESILSSLAAFSDKVKAKIDSYNLEITDQAAIAKINDRFEMYYEDLRNAKDGLYLVGLSFRSINKREENGE